MKLETAVISAFMLLSTACATHAYVPRGFDFEEIPRVNLEENHVYGTAPSLEDFEQMVRESSLREPTEEMWIVIKGSDSGVRWYEIGEEERRGSVSAYISTDDKVFSRGTEEGDEIIFYHTHPVVVEGRHEPPSRNDLVSDIQTASYFSGHIDLPISSRVITQTGVYVIEINNELLDELGIRGYNHRISNSREYNTMERLARECRRPEENDSNDCPTELMEELTTPLATFTYTPW